jgi:PHD/YefM family antitoxin component YafN of YafNO toxin-antitoxin module
MSISANELKTKGVSAIEPVLDHSTELIITVHGKERFVLMDMEHYNYLRKCELGAALHQARADVEAGKYITENIDAHIKRVTNGL